MRVVANFSRCSAINPVNPHLLFVPAKNHTCAHMDTLTFLCTHTGHSLQGQVVLCDFRVLWGWRLPHPLNLLGHCRAEPQAVQGLSA